MAGKTVLENTIDSDKNSTSGTKTLSKSTQPKSWNEIFLDLVSREEVEEIVKNAVSADVDLVNFNINPYSEDKLGFLASHQSLVVSYKRTGQYECEKCNFFVKVVPYDVPFRAVYVVERGCFRKESGFFKILLPLLTKKYVGEPWAPQCYLAKENIMIFEDLKFRGYSNRSKVFDKSTIMSAAACIAHLHACSLLAEEDQNGRSLIELYPELLEDTVFVRTGRFNTWFITAMNLAISVANELGLDSSSINRASESAFIFSKPSATKRNVLSHGDLWSSNMMFDGENHSKLVDFQLIRYAPLAHDLIHLIYMTTTREFREQYEKQIIKHYYLTLQKSLNTGMYRGVIPPFDEVLQGVEEQRLAALVTANIAHPTVLMDLKSAAKILDDPVACESYYFIDRKPFVDENMARNAEYEKRIKEDVKELVELSLRFDNLPKFS